MDIYRADSFIVNNLKYAKNSIYNVMLDDAVL